MKQNGTLLVFAQTAVFFYIINRAVFGATARLFDLHATTSLGGIYLVSLAMLVVLYLLCLWYRQYKSAHHDSRMRFI